MTRRVIDDDRSVVLRTAVYHAMADRDQVELLRFPQPIARCRHPCRYIGDRVRLV